MRVYVRVCGFFWVCVCVCVCERERECVLWWRERPRERERGSVVQNLFTSSNDVLVCSSQYFHRKKNLKHICSPYNQVSVKFETTNTFLTIFFDISIFCTVCGMHCLKIYRKFREIHTIFVHHTHFLP